MQTFPSTCRWHVCCSIQVADQFLQCRYPNASLRHPYFTWSSVWCRTQQLSKALQGNLLCSYSWKSLFWGFLQNSTVWLEICLYLNSTRSRLMESKSSWEILRLSDYEPLETLAFGVANEIADRIQPAAFSVFSNEQSPWTTLECGLRTLSWTIESYLLYPSTIWLTRSNLRGWLYEAGIVIT